MELSLPAGTKLRFYRMCNVYDDSTDPDNLQPGEPFLYASRDEFIGWPVGGPLDNPVDDAEYPARLYQDIAGTLHFCFGSEVKVGDWDLHVLIQCYCEEWGKSREEIVQKMRWSYDDADLPEILKPPPPEPEDMHTMTGWNS
jgi:hypothetical protein